MATKNFFLYLVGLSFFVNLTGCDSMPVKTSSHRQNETTPVDVGSATNNEPRVEAPEFLKKQAPKLGIILGPGGTLAYAHIGFLQELENNKIPVFAIGGIEWGALVAGAFAMENKSHGIEWNLLKLPTESFESRGFFSSGQKAVQVSAFKKFLNQTFKGKKIANMKTSFVCPYVNSVKGTRWLKRSGKVSSAIRSCWPSAPHFETPILAANLNGAASIAKALRNQGADLIVYVDVLSKSPLLKTDERKKNPQVAQQWLMQKSMTEALVSPLVNEVLYIDVAGANINSYKSLRSITRKGQVKSKSIVKGLANKYAY